jgi:hypothetical protein
MDIALRPIQVGVGSHVEEGRIVLVNGKLVAILVCLTGPYDTPGLQGKWFVEAGFGSLSEKHELFSTWEEAEAWVRHHCQATRKGGSGPTWLS